MSLARKLRRGTAIIVFNNVTKQNEIVNKKGFTGNFKQYKKKNELLLTAEQYCNSVTKPLTHEMIKKSKERHVFCV